MRSIKNFSSNWILPMHTNAHTLHAKTNKAHVFESFLLHPIIFYLFKFTILYESILRHSVFSCHEGKRNDSVSVCFWRCSFLIYYTLDCNANFLCKYWMYFCFAYSPPLPLYPSLSLSFWLTHCLSLFWYSGFAVVDLQWRRLIL